MDVENALSVDAQTEAVDTTIAPSARRSNGPRFIDCGDHEDFSGLRLTTAEGHALLKWELPKFKTGPTEINKLPAMNWLEAAPPLYPWDAALGALDEWQKRVEAAYVSLETLGKRVGDYTFCIDSELLTVAEWRGWKVAMAKLLGRVPRSITKHQDLVLWAKVQQRLASEVLSAYRWRPDHVRAWINDGTERPPVANCDIFRLAFPLLYKAEVNWREWAEATETLIIYASWDGNGGPLGVPRHQDSCTGGGRRRHLPTFISESGWAAMRSLHGRLRPPAPERVHGFKQLIRELDKIIYWGEQYFEPTREASNAVPESDTKPGKRTRRTRLEYNVICRDYLQQRMQRSPLPTVREVRGAVGCGMKMLYKLPAFVAVNEELSKGRKPRKPKTVSLKTDVVARDDESRQKELDRLVAESNREKNNFRVKSRERS